MTAFLPTIFLKQVRLSVVGTFLQTTFSITNDAKTILDKKMFFITINNLGRKGLKA